MSHLYALQYTLPQLCIPTLSKRDSRQSQTSFLRHDSVSYENIYFVQAIIVMIVIIMAITRLLLITYCRKRIILQ